MIHNDPIQNDLAVRNALGLHFSPPQKPDLTKAVREIIGHYSAHEVIKTVFAILKAEDEAADKRAKQARQALEAANAAIPRDVAQGAAQEGKTD